MTRLEELKAARDAARSSAWAAWAAAGYVSAAYEAELKNTAKENSDE
jgi:hypothetical protein